MNEAETRAELIDPALKAAGWGVVLDSRIGREVITPGRLLGGGKRAKPEYADYVLVYRNQKLAVIEAKKRELRDTEGVAQAKKYAEKLQVRFAYSTNSLGIYQIDMLTGAERHISEYPTLMNCGMRHSPKPTSGAIASQSSHLRTRAALGKRDIISTTPSPRFWRRSHQDKPGFC